MGCLIKMSRTKDTGKGNGLFNKNVQDYGHRERKWAV
jgi:hypothetical protein